MRKLIATSAVLSVLTGGSLFAGAAEGKAVYDKSCKACHGADGKGNPAIAKMMKVEMHPLSSAEVQGKSDAELKKIVTQGTGKMKPVASVGAAQIPDLIAYIRSLKK